MASTARRSAAAAAAKLPPKATSCWKARWITPSESAAALARPSGSSTSPSDDERPGRFQPLRRCFGAGQADHLVAGAEQLGHDGRTDPTRCAGNEDLHGAPPGRG